MKKNKFLVVACRVLPTMPDRTLITTDYMVGFSKFLVARRWKKSHKGYKFIGIVRVISYVK